MSVQAVHLAGTRAVLVDLTDLDSVIALNAALEASPLPGQVDVLAAAQTVLVKTDSFAAARAAAQAIPRLELGSITRSAGQLVELEVTYDGEDLAAVAELTGLSTEAVVNAHTTQTWQAAFGGFAPGFAYLLGENTSLSVPRRATPRTAVPAGAVALAGDYSAVYPRQSPGGWQLIGHTATALWDLERPTPALIRPQDRVRFIPVAAQATLNAPRPAPQNREPQVQSGLQILDPGLQSLLQDLGRAGLGNLGVAPAGAADTSSSRQANRLVGNAPGAAVIENLTGSMSVRALGDQVLAVSGANASLSIAPREDDTLRGLREAPMTTPFALLDGEVLTLAPAGGGLRSYLAIRGGFEHREALGSVSTDSLSGLGPAPLKAGDRVAAARPSGLHPVGNPEPSTLPEPDANGDFRLRIIPGPRQDWFGAAGLVRLTGHNWVVSHESNRVGLRLATSDDGEPLSRVADGELASEGMVAGSLQVPPSGLPVLFLADHPVTGGYPVIATVVAEDLPVAAQLPPGVPVRFTVSEQCPPLETDKGLHA